MTRKASPNCPVCHGCGVEDPMGFAMIPCPRCFPETDEDFKPTAKDAMMPMHDQDTDYPCPSTNPWQLWRADNGSEDYANIICEAVDVIVAVNVALHSAREIVACHNGETNRKDTQ
ncbi:hypothetical protein [Celeribacter naphthalenivorans]|uniref:hypothetical protein n=1 Tax=Celeribacter naphthalenivorans TaxID=1614694 RepID=UPI001CFA87E9|nr:hypothetical protein [Celeribacter naphthalenivorans]